MSTVFADAWFYIALLDRRDAHHRVAAEFARQSTGLIVTTRWVLLETANALARSVSRGGVAAFLADLEMDPAVRVTGSGNDAYSKGLALFGQRADKNWSLTDCISFVVMREEKLTEALTGDHHFVQAGFTAVLPSR